jgi:hypothetical protein
LVYNPIRSEEQNSEKVAAKFGEKSEKSEIKDLFLIGKLSMFQINQNGQADKMRTIIFPQSKNALKMKNP